MARPTDPCLDLAVAEVQEKERRKAVRVPATGRVSCRPACARTGESWVGRVHDISQTGIGIVLPRRWERGTILLLDLAPLRAGGPRNLCACVMHATTLAGEGFVVGCAHGADLTDDEIKAFVEEIEGPSTGAVGEDESLHAFSASSIQPPPSTRLPS